ncbi:hypothetical protein HMPREF9957_1544 [Streptococcus mitis SK1080]|uniref:Uncharacterized protein n=1 Tax=Streptococcus mitis SK1080 TaxID=1008453 RepID=F9HKG3_STRMT|nr:hypothetical protein HMPREF9957_1544 [Streptococcus mitis SK1080]
MKQQVVIAEFVEFVLELLVVEPIELFVNKQLAKIHSLKKQ